MGVYASAFVAMSASGHLGDDHPGQWTPYWEQACAADKRDACLNLYFLHDGYCEEGAAWSCNEIGILLAERYDNRAVAAAAFNRACTLQFAAGCDNAAAIARDGMLRHDDPTAADYPIHPPRQQGSDPRSRAWRALRARLRAGLAECLRGWVTRARTRDESRPVSGPGQPRYSKISATPK